MDEDFDVDWCQCPHCSGWGEVDCHCGGDLCVCDNDGRRTCPLCYGEGEVPEAVYARYLERQRENAKLFAEAATNKPEGGAP